MRNVFLAAIVWLLMLLCVRCASAQLLPDDYDSIFPVACGSNASHAAGGCASFSTSLYTFLAGEQAGENVEHGDVNFVVLPGTYGSPGSTVVVPANDCLGATAAGLTHTPPACYAYNAGVRAVETGAITYPNNSVCWVGIDQNRTGLVGAPPNFSRVSGAHYIVDCIDAAQPTMTASSQLLMKVTTAAGAITAVSDLRTKGGQGHGFGCPVAPGDALVQNCAITGAITISGTSANGSDSMLGVNKDRVVTPLSFDANHTIISSQNTTATCTAASKVVTLVAARDFLNGDAIAAAHCGGASTAVAPGGLTAVASNPTGGVTAWTYNICTYDGDTGQMSTCATVAVNNAAALNTNISGSHNILHWTAGSGGTATAVYNQTGLIGLIPIGVTSFMDTGQTVMTLNEVPASPPGVALAQRLESTVVSGGGTTTLTLADVATTAGAGEFFAHDAGPAIRGAFAKAQTDGVPVYIPPGNYRYFGAPLDGTATSFSIYGESPLMEPSSTVGALQQSVILLEDGGSFVRNTAAILRDLHFHNLTVINGLNDILFLGVGSSGSGVFSITNNHFYYFTGCAICSRGTNRPWTFIQHNQFRGNDDNATKAIGLAYAADGSKISDNAIIDVRIGIAEARSGFGMILDNNTVIHGLVRGFMRADIWYPQNASGALTISHTRFGNEGVLAGDYDILAADPDSASVPDNSFPVAPGANYGVGGIVIDAATGIGSGIITSATANFLTSAHVGDIVRIGTPLNPAGVQGRCGCELVSTIGSVDSDTQITLAVGTSTATTTSNTMYFGTASTQQDFLNVSIENNWIQSNNQLPGLVPSIPLVYTTNGRLAAWHLAGNVENPPCRAALVRFLPSRSTVPDAGSNTVSIERGLQAGITCDAFGANAGVSNENNVFSVVDPVQQFATWEHPPYYPTADSGTATDLIAAINSFTPEGGTTITPGTDRGGGADEAELGFISAVANNGVTSNYTPSSVGENWLTFDYKLGSGSPVHHFTVLAIDTGSVTLFQRDLEVPPTGVWTSISLPFVPRAAGLQIAVKIRPEGVNPAVETGTLDIGRLHVYQHESPMDLDGLFHLKPIAIGNLPGTCKAGDIRAVTDWNGTNGACTAGGANYSVAICGAANNWFCP